MATKLEIDIKIENDNSTNNCAISNGSTSSSTYSESCQNARNCVMELEECGELKLNIRVLACFGALLPGVGCFFCLFYTYLFDFDRVQNFTTPNCPHINSYFPPVSYSIGVWIPQKIFWLFVLIIHLPARLFFGIVYKNLYTYGESDFKGQRWFGNLVIVHQVVLLLEISGLVSVSIFDMEKNFLLHALSFCVWVISFDFNMLFNTMLHYYSGIRQLNKTLYNTFYIKCTLFMTGYPLSWSTGFSYFTFLLTCSSTAYALFSIAEYLLVFINSFFYFMVVWEAKGYCVEIHIKQKILNEKEPISKSKL